MPQSLPEWAADQLARLEARIAHLERAPRLANSSIDDGSINVKDEDERVREVIGRQPDGSHGSRVVLSPDQPTPLGLEVTVGKAGSTEVSWPGGASGDVPLVHGRVEVWSQFVAEGEQPDVAQARLRSTIRDRDGGSTTISCPIPGVWAVWLRMVGQDNVTASEFSEPTLFTVEALFDVSDFEARLQAFTDGDLDDAAYENLMARTAEFLLVRAGQVEANAIDGMVITAGIFQTQHEAQRGVKLQPSGLRGWDSSGALNFELDTNGHLTAKESNIEGRFQAGTGANRAEIDQGDVTYFSPIDGANRTLSNVPYLRFSTPDGAGGTTDPLIAAKPTGGLVLGSGRNSPQFGRSVIEIDGHLNALGADFTSHVNTTSVYAAIGITGIGTNNQQLGGLVSSGARTRLQGRTADSHDARDTYVRGASTSFSLPESNSVQLINFTYGAPTPTGDRMPFVTCSTQLSNNTNGRMAIVGVGNISEVGFQGVARNASGGSPVSYNLLYNALWR